MSNTVTLSFNFQPQRGPNGRRKPSPRPSHVPAGNVPRVAKLMALALHFENLRRRKVVHDYADLARLGGVTRARITQIMSLLNLAPAIQEELLFLPRTEKGGDPITAGKVLPIARELPWRKQRRMWGELKKSAFR